MILKIIARKIISLFHQIEEWSQAEETRVYKPGAGLAEESIGGVCGVWDYLDFRPNTQAYHLAGSLGFDEWVDMNEIRRRIKELFGVEYKNERSLYPYLKTLTDIGLMENSGVGGRMHWRKHDLIIKMEKENKQKTIIVEASAAKEGKNRRENKNEIA